MVNFQVDHNLSFGQTKISICITCTNQQPLVNNGLILLEIFSDMSLDEMQFFNQHYTLRVVFIFLGHIRSAVLEMSDKSVFFS